jgi:hypothetical protein
LMTSLPVRKEGRRWIFVRCSVRRFAKNNQAHRSLIRVVGSCSCPSLAAYCAKKAKDSFCCKSEADKSARVGPRATVPRPDTQRSSRTSCAAFGSSPLVCTHAELITAALSIGLQRALTAVDWSRLNSHHVIPISLLIYV